MNGHRGSAVKIALLHVPGDPVPSKRHGEIETVKSIAVLTQDRDGLDHHTRIAGILSQHSIQPPNRHSWVYAEAMERAGRQPA
jgi:hypothetical protein